MHSANRLGDVLSEMVIENDLSPVTGTKPDD